MVSHYRGVRLILQTSENVGLRTFRYQASRGIPSGEEMRGRSLRRGSASFLGQFEIDPADSASFTSEASAYDGVQDVPIGLCTVRPAFGKMHTMFRRTRIQGVLPVPLEGRRAREDEGACFIPRPVVAAE
jgi:hypothetical protein